MIDWMFGSGTFRMKVPDNNPPLAEIELNEYQASDHTLRASVFALRATPRQEAHGEEAQGWKLKAQSKNVMENGAPCASTGSWQARPASVVGGPLSVVKSVKAQGHDLHRLRLRCGGRAHGSRQKIKQAESNKLKGENDFRFKVSGARCKENQGNKKSKDAIQLGGTWPPSDAL